MPDQSNNSTQQTSPQLQSPPASNIPIQTSEKISESASEKPAKSNITKYVLFIIGLILALLLSAIVGAFLYKRVFPENSSETAIVPTILPSQTNSLSPTSLPTPVPTNLNKSNTTLSAVNSDYEEYISELGVSFKYAPTAYGGIAAVKEDGNKIFVGSNQAWHSQYIEVFTKNTQVSVKEDIEAKLVSPYSQEDCQVTEPIPPSDFPQNSLYVQDGSYLMLTIESNISQEDFGTYISETEQKCPVAYTPTNWAGYFLYHQDHPDKYVFISIGQDSGWPSSTNPDTIATWQDTIEFID